MHSLASSEPDLPPLAQTVLESPPYDLDARERRRARRELEEYDSDDEYARRRRRARAAAAGASSGSRTKGTAGSAGSEDMDLAYGEEEVDAYRAPERPSAGDRRTSIWRKMGF